MPAEKFLWALRMGWALYVYHMTLRELTQVWDQIVKAVTHSVEALQVVMEHIEGEMNQWG